MDIIKVKLKPIYWFEHGIIALCDREDIISCDADEDCNECKSNHLKQVIIQSKKAAQSFLSTEP